MCGINGFNFENEGKIKDMNKIIQHRGPDNSDIFVDKISLGHQRLSIIDLSENANQPMFNEDKSIVIVFNGEIYNFKELKQELQEKHEFKSNCDTEVILHAYEEWGEDCVKKFNGMWGFCIYDKNKNQLFLSRDRLGIKPLYYYLDGNFIFSSEIKAILKHNIEKKLNKKAVSSFLSYRYVLGEETFFKNIFKLLPGHNLVFDLNENKIIKKYAYWDLENRKLDLNEEEAKDIVEKLLQQSVEYRKISDVPLGVILSGGLDSSVLAALLAKKSNEKINTFTVKFNEQGFDETEFAKIVAEKYNTNYFEVQLDTSNLFDLMKEYTKYRDSPVGVANEIALYLLAKKIKKNVTVVLAGEGADEIFQGYGRIFSSVRDYQILKKLKQENNVEDYKTRFSSLFEKYNGKLFDSELDHFLYLYNYWADDEKNFILLPEFKTDFKDIFRKYLYKHDVDYDKKISYVFLKLHLPGLLNRLDSPTMANAVEARVGFLDHNLVQIVFNLGLDFKTKWHLNEQELLELNKNCDELSEINNTSKYLLKQVSKNHLPDTIINRKKQGFPMPLQNWFKGDFLENAKQLLLNKDSKIKAVINQDNLNIWIEQNKNNKDFGLKLWMLISLEFWLREWFSEL